MAGARGTRSRAPQQFRVSPNAGLTYTRHPNRNRATDSRMDFANTALSGLMATMPADQVAAAEWANLCLEERVAAPRQSVYEARMDRPVEWPDWRAAHFRYVQQDVRRRHPLSAAFDAGDALRPHIEANQELYRVERIDALLNDYAAGAFGLDQLRQWISNRDADRTAGPLAAGAPLPTDAALADFTRFLNRQFADGRPRFVAFAAEFPDLERQADWPRVICERCGLAHHFTGTTVTLALFRYSVREVLDAYTDTEPSATVFAAPTVLDLPMSNVYFSAPKLSNVGHAVGLAPRSDCTHLAAELIHARMDYRPEHWVAVGTVSKGDLYAADISQLRDTHLHCLRRTPGNADYGSDCVA